MTTYSACKNIFIIFVCMMKVAHGLWSVVWRDISVSYLRPNHHLNRLQGIKFIPFIPTKVRCAIFLIVRVMTINVGPETIVRPPRRFKFSGTVTVAHPVIILVQCRKLAVIAVLQAIPYNQIGHDWYLWMKFIFVQSPFLISYWNIIPI